MKKRILAAMLAILMLFGASAAPTLAGAEEEVWSAASEYFDGGDVKFGTLELHSGGAYATLHFAYGYGLKATEGGMQAIAGLLSENRFPAVNLPFDSETVGGQSIFVLSADNSASVDALIAALEQQKSTAVPETAVSDADVSGTDVSGSDAVEVTVQLTAEQAATLLDLFGKFGTESEVSASDVSATDAVSGADAPAASATDAVSGTDVSGTDVSASDEVGS